MFIFVTLESFSHSHCVAPPVIINHSPIIYASAERRHSLSSKTGVALITGVPQVQSSVHSQ